MNTRNWNMVLLVVLLVLSVPVAELAAQDSGRRGPPPRKEHAQPSGPDLQTWADAYDRAREPSILVLVGWATGDITSGGVGEGVLNRDATGFAQSLRSEFERSLMAGEILPDFIDQEALNNAMQRLGNILEQGHEDEAIRLLANHVGADLVILFELYGRAGSPPNRVTGRVLDMNRGRVIVRFPSFEWQLDTDAPSVRRYAGAFAERFVEDFNRAIDQSRQYTMNLLGVREIDTLDTIRNQVEKVPGVMSVRHRRSSRTNDGGVGGGESVYTLNVTYDDDALRLAMRTKRVIEGLGEFHVEEREIIGESITLRVYERQEYAEEAMDCDAVILRHGSAGDEARGELSRLYDEKNRPKIVVFVNRRPTLEEEREAEVASGGGPASVNAENLIMISTVASGRDTNVRDQGSSSDRTPGDSDSEFSEPEVLRMQAELIETAMLERLGIRHLKLNTVDADEARRIVAAEAAKQGEIYRESEMTRILARQNVADIAIYGMGSRTSNRSAGVTYTFRAVDVRNASLLGTAIVNSPFDIGRFVVLGEKLAERAVEELVCDLKASWLPPSHVAVTLKQVDGPEDFSALERLIEQSPQIWISGSETADFGPGTGVVTFRLDYACSFSELKREFERIMDALPYTLITESSSDSAFTFAIQRDG